MFSTLALLLLLGLIALALAQLAINASYLHWLTRYYCPSPETHTLEKRSLEPPASENQSHATASTATTPPVGALASGALAIGAPIVGESTVIWPKAAVILCLRGGDETLERCLNSLSRLCYPDFQIHIVLDNALDPVRPLVERWRERQPGLEIHLHVLTQISSYCYLKTSAIRQCVATLDDDVGAIAVVDADTVVYPAWLHDMVAPMCGTAVGLVTGNRWYDPAAANFGSTVRFLYNAWSVPIMYFMQAAWAGSLAIDRRVFSQAYFYERMQRASSEEFAMQESTRHAGLQAHVSGRVLMPQFDQIEWISCLRFMRRQLVWTRLYHPAWLAIMLAPLLIYLFFLALFGVGCWRAAEGNWPEALLLWCSIIGYIVLNCWIVDRLHRAITDCIEAVQQRSLPAITWRTFCRLACVTPFALVTFALATLSAHCARRVAWRGIEYRIVPPGDIEMVRYVPLMAEPTRSQLCERV